MDAFESPTDARADLVQEAPEIQRAKGMSYPMATGVRLKHRFLDVVDSTKRFDETGLFDVSDAQREATACSPEEQESIRGDYDELLHVFSAHKLLDREGNILGIDGERYKVPTLGAVFAAMDGQKREEVVGKIGQSRKLLMTPIANPLVRLSRRLQKPFYSLGGGYGLSMDTCDSMSSGIGWSGDLTGKLRYNAGSREVTKKELLAMTKQGPFPGWLVSMARTYPDFMRSHDGLNVLQAYDEALNAGEAFGLYPEEWLVLNAMLIRKDQSQMRDGHELLGARTDNKVRNRAIIGWKSYVAGGGGGLGVSRTAHYIGLSLLKEEEDKKVMAYDREITMAKARRVVRL